MTTTCAGSGEFGASLPSKVTTSRVHSISSVDRCSAWCGEFRQGAWGGNPPYGMGFGSVGFTAGLVKTQRTKGGEK